MKCHLTIPTILWFAAGLFAHGESTLHSVTPEKLDAGQFIFLVASQSVEKGMSFEITITAKSAVIPADSSANLSVVKRMQSSGGGTSEIQRESEIKIAKESQSWKVTFVVSKDLLKTPDMSFVFEVPAHSIIDGKPLPAGDFYTIKLQDFIKK